MRDLISKKKAQGLSIEMVIILIFGAAVLVLGFMLIFNTGGLRDRIFGFSGGASNVDDIKQQCALACAQQRTTEYTSTIKNVVMPDKTKIAATCQQLEGTRLDGCQDPDGKLIADIASSDKCKAAFVNNVCTVNGISFTVASGADCKATWVGTFSNAIITDKCTSI